MLDVVIKRVAVADAFERELRSGGKEICECSLRSTESLRRTEPVTRFGAQKRTERLRD
jgi:hypothetical protein